MNSYYTAFDFGQKRVGFAELTSGDGEQCQNDLGYDANYEGDPLPPPVSQPAPQGTDVETYTPPPPLSNAQSRTSSGLGTGGGSSGGSSDSNAMIAGLLVLAIGVILVSAVLNRRREHVRHQRIESMMMANDDDGDLALGEMELPGLL